MFSFIFSNIFCIPFFFFTKFLIYLKVLNYMLSSISFQLYKYIYFENFHVYD